ncbi:MAG: PAS domain-containing protein [Candidatus Tectomicrobia bacterium]|nr:PAS domain-containing protein [Candidatus Tectomicrobia bacterium]
MAGLDLLATFEGLQLGILLLSEHGQVTFANRAACRLLGTKRRHLLAAPFVERYGARFGCAACRDWTVLRRAQGRTLETPYSPPSRPGRELRLSIVATRANGRPALLLALRDLTAELRQQAQEERSRRLQSLERLAGRVAHKIRNPLTSIQLYASLLQNLDDLEPHALQRYGEKITQGVQAVERILTAMQWFAKQLKPVLQPLDMHRQVREVLFFIEQIARRRDLVIETSLRARRAVVLADHELIKQMLLNIFQNSVQAQPEGGMIMVETFDGEAPRPQPAAPRRAAAGRAPDAARRFNGRAHPLPGRTELTTSPPAGEADDGVLEVRISDCGPGIVEEELAEVFNPFVSSKPGMAGLGLSIVHHIVEVHRGTVEARNREPRGCAISIRLPRLAAGAVDLACLTAGGAAPGPGTPGEGVN